MRARGAGYGMLNRHFVTRLGEPAGPRCKKLFVLEPTGCHHAARAPTADRFSGTTGGPGYGEVRASRRHQQRPGDRRYGKEIVAAHFHIGGWS